MERKKICLLSLRVKSVNYKKKKKILKKKKKNKRKKQINNAINLTKGKRNAEFPRISVFVGLLRQYVDMYVW